MVLNRVSDRVDPIFMRLLWCCSINWKCCFNSLRWAFGLSLSVSFMLQSWSSASSRYSVLLVVALVFTIFHMSSADVRSFIFAPRCVEVVERMICWARYSRFSNSAIFVSLASICYSVAGVVRSVRTWTPDTTVYGLGAMAVPSTCLHSPFDPMAFQILGL